MYVTISHIVHAEIERPSVATGTFYLLCLHTDKVLRSYSYRYGFAFSYRKARFYAQYRIRLAMYTHITSPICTYRLKPALHNLNKLSRSRVPLELSDAA